MRAFGEIVMTTPGILLRVGMLLLGYWELYLAILVIRRRRRASVIAVGAGQLLLWFFAFVLLLDWGGSMLEGYAQYMTALSLYEIGQALLLIGAVFSVCIEDVYISRR